MRRLLLGILLSVSIAGSAPAQDKTFSVMMILFRGMTAAEHGFMDALKSRVPVDFIIRDVDGSRAAVGEYVQEAKIKRPDLVYTFGTTVTLDAVGAAGAANPARHLTDIPVVFNIVADPVGAKLAPSFAPTGRNLTGVSHLVPMPDQLRAMQRFRTVKKLGVIFNPVEANSALAVVQLKQHAAEFGYALLEAPLLTPPGQRPTIV